jgi:predicted Ser/Thr protein kinase
MKEIEVTNIDNADVEVVNHSPLTMIGKGRQGAVFQFSDDICVKVFGNTEDCEREHYALSLGQHTDLFPKVYAKGTLYIAMEIIKGVDLREYLQSQPLTEELSIKLINMLITFKEIGYERIDHHKRQIYLQPDGNLKVIDVARTVWRDRVYPYPRKLLVSLGEENKELFLSHVQAISPELYEEWKHYIRMEELSRQIYHVLLTKPPKKDKIKDLSQKLLTTDDELLYVTQLESLVYKVFKEEWVKTMLARGVDPDAVMEKIDKHWEKREKNNATYNENLNVKGKQNEQDLKKKEKDKGKQNEQDLNVEQDLKKKEKDKDKQNEQEKKSGSKSKNKSTGNESYFGYRENRNKESKGNFNGYQQYDSSPYENRNSKNDKLSNWFGTNESNNQSKRKR